MNFIRWLDESECLSRQMWMAFLWHELLSRIICYWKSYQHHNRIDSIFSIGSVGTKEWIRIPPCCKSGVYFLISLKIMSKDFFISNPLRSLWDCEDCICSCDYRHLETFSNSVIITDHYRWADHNIENNDLVTLNINYRIYQLGWVSAGTE